MELTKLSPQSAGFQAPGLEHRKIEDRVTRLRAVLRAICTANRFIAGEENQDKLIEGVCTRIIETRGCNNAWIALLDETGVLVTSAEAGLGEDFLPLIEQLKRGELNGCMQMAMRQSDVVVIKNPLSTCADCPLSTLYNDSGAITVRLEHDGRIYGLLSVSISRDCITDVEEQALIREIAAFLASALYSIEVREDRKREESQLKYEQRMKAISTLAGSMAHNFNNILMGIMGNATLMLLEADPTNPNYKRLKNIEKSVRRGTRLTNQLLGYVKGEHSEFRPIDVNQLVKETIDAFSVSRKGLRIHQDLAKDLWKIKGDQVQIEHVLLNLCVNAADAMPGGGNLILKTRNVSDRDMRGKPYKVEPGRYVFLAVTDTGTGIDKETMDRVFDPFFTTKGMSKSTGFGLASAYVIVKSHGGYIDVDSKTGHGTTFEVYLPAIERKIKKRINSIIN